MRDKIVELLKDPFTKIILSNPTNKSNEYRRINVTRKVIKGNEVCQIEKATEKQVFHENVTESVLLDKLVEYMNDFKQLNYYSATREYEIKVSKKGQIFMNSRELKHDIKINLQNNRKKNYILEEGTVIPPLVDLGVFTSEGKVVRSMYDKYKQINRFIELVDDVLKDYDLDEIRILDFGCGKSYLTFIVYYYLTEVKKIKADITGLDLKMDVINNCNEIAEKYGYTGLKFEVGDIANYKYNNNVDMVMTLHACDTATDFALFNAMCWNAKFILSVPCCQHEINFQIKSDDYSLITKYGLIRERMSALITDSIRANCLEIAGYKTQVVEFIDMEHSPKNILLRAVKGSVSDQRRAKSKAEVDKMIMDFNLNPTLVRLMKEKGIY